MVANLSVPLKITGLALLALLLGLNPGALAVDEPRVSIEPNRYDFGEIYSGSRVQSEILFKIRLQSSLPLP